MSQQLAARFAVRASYLNKLNETKEAARAAKLAAYLAGRAAR